MEVATPDTGADPELLNIKSIWGLQEEAKRRPLPECEENGYGYFSRRYILIGGPTRLHVKHTHVSRDPSTHTNTQHE
jgi:hypothetical protein